MNLLLPADSLEADDFSNDANTNNIEPYADGGGIRDGWEGLDIGAKAIEEFCDVLEDAKTVVWNGPMGVFEIDAFSKGTRAVAETVANSDAVSIIGGGDSVTAVKKFGLGDKVTFISTGWRCLPRAARRQRAAGRGGTRRCLRIPIVSDQRIQSPNLTK